jgi:hypothetical protein
MQKFFFLKYNLESAETCDDFKEKVIFSLYFPFDTYISANIDLKCLKNQLSSNFNMENLVLL